MTRLILVALAAAFITAVTVSAQGVPRTLSLQGLLTDSAGAPVADGPHELEVKIYDTQGGSGVELWSSSIIVDTADGIFHAVLGASTPLDLPFDQPYLIGLAVDGDDELVPRLPLTSSAYSLSAATVDDDAIVAAKIADGTVVRSLNGLTDDVGLVGSGSIMITQVGNDLVIDGSGGGADADWAINGNNMYAVPTGNVGVGTTSPAADFHVADDNFSTNLLIEDETPGTAHRTTITLDNQQSTFLFDYVTSPTQDFNRLTMGAGQITDIQLYSRDLELRGTTVDCYVNGTKRTGLNGSVMELHDSGGAATIELETETRGKVELRRDTGALGLRLDADEGTGAAIRGHDEAGDLAYWLNASSIGTTNLTLYDTATNQGTIVATSRGGAPGAQLFLTRDDGTTTVQVEAQEDGSATQGGQILLYANVGDETVEIDGDFGGSNGGAIRLFDSGGTATVQMIADQNGEGRIIADVVEIRGGADLSERFDVSSSTGVEIRPGMVVSIDPDAPGALTLAREPYDRRVAGVISGAGGVSPGVIMSETGSIADGAYPVALTGRVYVYVDASFGAVAPGDLLTSSPVPGHAMRAADPERAAGAVIGKAMTSLDRGRGLVLVLVGLR